MCHARGPAAGGNNTDTWNGLIQRRFPVLQQDNECAFCHGPLGPLSAGCCVLSWALAFHVPCAEGRRVRILPWAARPLVRGLLRPFLRPRLSRPVRRGAAVFQHQASMPHVPRGASSGTGTAFRGRLPASLSSKWARVAQWQFLGSANDHPPPHDKQGDWCLGRRDNARACCRAVLYGQHLRTGP